MKDRRRLGDSGAQFIFAGKVKKQKTKPERNKNVA